MKVRVEGKSQRDMAKVGVQKHEDEHFIVLDGAHFYLKPGDDVKKGDVLPIYYKDWDGNMRQWDRIPTCVVCKV